MPTPSGHTELKKGQVVYRDGHKYTGSCPSGIHPDNVKKKVVTDPIGKQSDKNDKAKNK